MLTSASWKCETPSVLGCGRPHFCAEANCRFLAFPSEALRGGGCPAANAGDAEQKHGQRTFSGTQANYRCADGQGQTLIYKIYATERPLRCCESSIRDLAGGVSGCRVFIANHQNKSS